MPPEVHRTCGRGPRGPGLEVDRGTGRGIEAHIRLKAGARLERPVCPPCASRHAAEKAFNGSSPNWTSKKARTRSPAHCTFPNAVEVEAPYDARIRIAPGGTIVLERHVTAAGGASRYSRKRRGACEGALQNRIRPHQGTRRRDGHRLHAVCQAAQPCWSGGPISAPGTDKVRIHEKPLAANRPRAASRPSIALRGPCPCRGSTHHRGCSTHARPC